MSEDKLQTLLATLKKQGLEAGEALGREKIESAQREAEKILAEAKSEAEKIVAEAKGEADRQLKRLQSSLEVAALKYVNQLKQKAMEHLLTLPLKKELDARMGEAEFLKTMAQSFIESYAANRPGEAMQVQVPSSTPDEVTSVIAAMIRKYGRLEGEQKVVVKDPSLKLGFMVDLNNGQVRLDLSDEAFLSYFLEQLSPEFRKYFNSLDLQAGAE